MKKKLLLMLMSVAVYAAMGSMFELQAQEPPVAGGYQEASRTDLSVISAAKFALKEWRRRKRARVSLISIERAETQVVAGVNYRLCLRVKTRGKIRSVRTVVYQNLQQKYSLSNWEEGACSSASGA